MRLTVAALIAMLALPLTTSGQESAGAERRSTPSWSVAPHMVSRDPLPTWAIPPLLGSRPADDRRWPADDRRSTIGLPLPSIGLQPQVDRHRQGRRRSSQTVVAWPPVFYVVPQAVALPPDARHGPINDGRWTIADRRGRSTMGELALEVRPGTAQVFIDGYYVGTPDDFNAGRGGLSVEAGSHRVELSAPGHETVSFDVRISPNQSIVYRRELTPLDIASPPPPVSVSPQPSLTPQTFYVIPGCYLGNVPPVDAGLPSTCDVSRAMTFTSR